MIPGRDPVFLNIFCCPQNGTSVKHFFIPLEGSSQGRSESGVRQVGQAHVSDESQLQVTRKDGESSLTVSKVQSGLIARGRRDAAMPAKPSPPDPTDPLAETRRLAEAGDADAQYRLGDAYAHGEGEDYGQAIHWWLKAADQGHTRAWDYLHYFYKWDLYDNKKGAAEARAEGVHWLRKAAGEGNADAKSILGAAYFYGRGVQQDDAESARLWQEASEAGCHRNTEYLGYLYFDAGVAQNYSEAVKWLRKSTRSEFGYVELCLGKCYFYGLGVQQDYAEAARWLLDALHTDAAPYEEIGYLLSRIYAFDEVMKKWRWPAEGEDGWQDYTEDVKWNRENTEAGYEAGQFNFGLAYAYGRGVQRDDAEAAKWFRKAADEGSVWAQFHLAVAYDKGRGVPQDYVQAHMWLSLASRAEVRSKMSTLATGDVQKYASDARGELARKMTPQQIEEAQRLTREWKSSK